MWNFSKIKKRSLKDWVHRKHCKMGVSLSILWVLNKRKQRLVNASGDRRMRPCVSIG